MASEVQDRATAAAIDQIVAGFAALTTAGVEPVDIIDANQGCRELEGLVRLAVAAQVAHAERVEQRGLHRIDGHASVKVWLRHNARLSNAEALRRVRAAHCLRDLPAVREAFASGRIGICHLDRIALAHANPRVRRELCELDEHLAVLASRLSYDELDQRLTDWVRLTDEDGTRPANDRNHHNRDASLLQDRDLSWRLRASCGSLSGARMRSIFDAAIAAELQLDWEKARAEHGDAATGADLPRTDAQRRFGALEHLFDLAAAGHRAETGTTITTDLVIDHTTFARETTRLTGTEPGPRRNPVDLDLTIDGTPYRCHTEHGHPVEATEAVAAALLGRIRRAVFGAEGVVIDVGRRARLFTGAAQLAATIAHRHCYWPGCQTPVHHCQTDHLQPWAEGGPTSPGNGAPACGRHNRLKEHGYTVHRDQHGQLHTHRPDGTEIA
ncbi:HNH endonuclease [Aquihabitans sp. G128]|uniref:HNH endonuclease signature motif containing protein n=1 Tax=Aquihabitans sp. G128 TaxID=2849779 RepID=UPI001C21FCDE|nr:HNH endonuclease signature motif containing protein [Aquihabitans sp. G128]QXC60834.1 HNH endonuclease [Aquihabitans sp. G128]